MKTEEFETNLNLINELKFAPLNLKITTVVLQETAIFSDFAGKIREV